MNAGFELFLWNLGRGMWHLKLWVSMKMEKGLGLQRSQEGPHCWRRFMLELQLLFGGKTSTLSPQGLTPAPSRSLLSHQPQVLRSGCVLGSLVLLRYRPCPTDCRFLWCWSLPTTSFLQSCTSGGRDWIHFAKIYEHLAREGLGLDSK